MVSGLRQLGSTRAWQAVKKEEARRKGRMRRLAWGPYLSCTCSPAHPAWSDLSFAKFRKGEVTASSSCRNIW